MGDNDNMFDIDISESGEGRDGNNFEDNNIPEVGDQENLNQFDPTLDVVDNYNTDNYQNISYIRQNSDYQNPYMNEVGVFDNNNIDQNLQGSYYGMPPTMIQQNSINQVVELAIDPKIEIKMDEEIIQKEEDQPIDIEPIQPEIPLFQFNSVHDLNFNHLHPAEPDQNEINNQSNAEPSFIQFQGDKFNKLFSEQFNANPNVIHPPSHFKHFNSPRSMQPPNLNVIQKNKQFYSLGSAIDFSSIQAVSNKLVTDEENKEVENILQGSNGNVYDGMTDLNSSIMNKSLEILQNSSCGGANMKDYIEDMDTLLHKFSVLCKIAKIKLAKIEVKQIFKNEESLFKKSTEQINKSIEQIAAFQKTLQIKEILNNQSII